MTNREQIDQGIFELDYHPEEILAFQGNEYENFVPNSSNWSDDEFYVVKRTLNELSGSFDISAPNASKDVTYPGGLLMGNKGIVDGSPQALVAKRNPISLSIDLPGMGEKSCVTVENPMYENVHAAIDGMLENWYHAHSDKNNIPADFQMKSSMVRDEKQLALDLDVSVKYLRNELGVDFSSVYQRKKSTYITEFKQIFYTVSAGQPTKPSDVFAEDVTWDSLVKRGISSQQPPMYVRNVQYGRQIFVCFESTMSDDQLRAALDGKVTLKNGIAIVGKGSISGGYTYDDIKVKMVVLGGRGDIYTGVMSSDEFVKKLNEVIFENTQLSAQNPAYQLSYLPCFLKDNKPAEVVGMTKYVTEQVTKYRNGTLNLHHSGAYVAKFNVTWEEYEYDNHGDIKVSNHAWGQNDKNKTAGFDANINLPANSRNICIRAEGKTGLIWDPWHNPIDKKNLSLVEHRTAKVWGTTLNQKGEVNPC